MRSLKRWFGSGPEAATFGILIVAIAFAIVFFSHATTPNPGHPWTDVGNGNFAVANTQTATRTYTFPDLDAEILTSSSSITFLQETVTATTTLSTSSDMVIYVNASSNPVTIILPLANSAPGQVYIIKKIDSSLTNQVTIQATSTDTIDSITSISFANRGEGAMFQSDGTIWRILMRRDYDFDAFHTRGTTANQFYTSPNAGTALTTAALVANNIYAMPLVLSKVTTIDQIAFNVTVASGTAEIGIYNDNGNEFPGTLAVDAGSINIAAVTGVKTSTTNLPITLDAGLYWMVINPSNTLTIRGFAVAAVLPILGYASTIPTNAQFGWKGAQTKGALPNPYPSGANTVITGAPIPALFVRFSQ